jgi:hypothetical protein
MAITRLAWVLTVVALATTAFASAQTIPELAKARPANPVVRGILQDIPASSIDELTKGAAIVAEGVISHERSYLTPDEQHIQTDFQIIPSRVIAARPSSRAFNAGPAAATNARGDGRKIHRGWLYGLRGRSQSRESQSWGTVPLVSETVPASREIPVVRCGGLRN